MTGVGAVGVALAGAGSPRADDLPPRTTGEALDRLKAGNRRFVEGQTRHAHQGADWRKMLAADQHPFATVLGCSDSRVPTELVFDQGFGDLFVIRVAGNIVAPDVVGSMAYAAAHLHTSLFVVLGHTGCGAVTAAVDSRLGRIKEPERIQALLDLIEPGLTRLDMSAARPKLIDAAVEANVRWSIGQLAGIPAARRALEDRRLELVGAVYDLTTGAVRFLKG